MLAPYNFCDHRSSAEEHGLAWAALPSATAVIGEMPHTVQGNEAVICSRAQAGATFVYAQTSALRAFSRTDLWNLLKFCSQLFFYIS